MPLQAPANSEQNLPRVLRRQVFDSREAGRTPEPLTVSRRHTFGALVDRVS
jgi:hypothetical protein